MNNVLLRLKNVVNRVFFRFPASSLCLIMICILSIFYRSIDRLCRLDIAKLYIVLFQGLIITFATDIVLENLNKKINSIRLIAYAVTGIVLFLEYVALLKEEFLIRNGFGIICLTNALIFLTVFLFKNKKRGSFELNLVNLVNNFVWSFMVASIIYLLSITSLFVLDIFFEINGFRNVAIVVYSLVFPYMFLYRVPKVGQQLEYPKFFGGIVKFVGVPAGLFMLVVLNIVCGKHLIYGIKDVDIFLRIAMTFLADYILLMLFIAPFKERLYVNIRKWSVLLLLPIIAMMVYIVCHNIMSCRESYGLGYRYRAYLSLYYWIFIDAILALVYIVLTKVKDSKYQYMIFLAVAICFVIAGFGPLSMNNVVSKLREFVKLGSCCP